MGAGRVPGAALGVRKVLDGSALGQQQRQPRFGVGQAQHGGQLPGRCQLPDTPQAVSHEDFKRLTQQARVMVRTGECTPYANVILVAGVTF